MCKLARHKHARFIPNSYVIDSKKIFFTLEIIFSECVKKIDDCRDFSVGISDVVIIAELNIPLSLRFSLTMSFS